MSARTATSPTPSWFPKFTPIAPLLAAVFGLLMLAGIAIAQDPPARIGRLSDDGGDIFLSTDNSAAGWQPVGINYPITMGDNVFVSRDGRAEIDFGGGQLQMHRLGEVARCFVSGEAKVGGAELEQVAAGSPPCERQGRVGPGGEHEMKVRWGVFHKEADGVVDVGRVDDVVVVQDKGDVGVEPFQVVDQRCHRSVKRLCGLQERFGGTTDIWCDRPECGDEI